MTFILILGIVIEMIRQSNAASAFVDFASKRMKNAKSAETSVLLLSHSLSIDDYLSSLTVGSVMRPLTDKFKVCRAKLAFLTDSMAAPMAMLTPISSWSAAIIGFLTENGVHATASGSTLLLENPYSVYWNILPYIFYSITLVLSVWFIVRCGLSFGTMHAHERIAQKTGNLMGGKPLGDQHFDGENQTMHQTIIADFVVPIGSLLASTVFFILFLGDSILFGGSKGIVATMQSAPIALVLFSSGTTTLLISTVYYLSRGIFTLKKLASVAVSGVKLMLPVVAILLFAWTMGDLLRGNLKTGELLASLFADAIPITLMPLILFWNATAISLALGSSWATTAILLPIAIPMVISMTGLEAPAKLDSLPIMLPVFGAILSGAVCGDHISLISETTIMAVTSSMCDYMDHVRTQMVYSTPAFIGSSVAFLLSGLLFEAPPMLSLLVSLGTSLTISFVLLSALHYARKYRAVSVEG
jgi:Na+/H+ antiporter NhaC